MTKDRKYTVEKMLPALRYFVRARNEVVSRGILGDNGGAIHSVERIVNILGPLICYPQISHINKLKECPNAHRSVAAEQARQRGEKVEIEHVRPLRAFSITICDQIDGGASDDEVRQYIKSEFRLVLLTKEERSALDRINRSRIADDRLGEAGIAMFHFDQFTKCGPSSL